MNTRQLGAGQFNRFYIVISIYPLCSEIPKPYGDIFISTLPKYILVVHMTEIYVMKEILREVKDLKKMFMKMEDMIEWDILTKEDLNAIRMSESEIKRGKFVTLEQLKTDLGI